MKKVKRSAKRNWIQLASAVFFNGYALGYQWGHIFTGKSKMFCVPILNCYSCPGALGACPIGSLQSLAGGRKFRLSFYVLGMLMLFGLFLGRAVCGFLCPFGWLQDLLYRIPCRKITISAKLDCWLRYIKYVVLALFVFLLPALLRNQYGMGTTWFCKYICPAGTLGAGIPLLLTNEGLRQAVGLLFQLKFTVLVIVMVLSVLTYRPFCKYLCPLGAFYALFNRFSLYRLTLDKDRCIDCRLCEKICKMGVQVTQNINSPECIRCGDCMEACPKSCISREQLLGKSGEKKDI